MSATVKTKLTPEEYLEFERKAEIDFSLIECCVALVEIYDRTDFSTE